MEARRVSRSGLRKPAEQETSYRAVSPYQQPCRRLCGSESDNIEPQRRHMVDIIDFSQWLNLAISGLKDDFDIAQGVENKNYYTSRILVGNGETLVNVGGCFTVLRPL